MARLTDRELDLIQQARRSPSWRTWEEMDLILLEARRERARVMARLMRRGFAFLVRVTGLAATARLVTERIVVPLRRDALRRRTVKELNRLEDHLLKDIGIARDEVARLAAHVGLVAGLRSWLRRRAAIRELEALDDHMLSDIGLVRGNIREAVERAAAEAPPAKTGRDLAVAGLSALRNWIPVRQVAGLFGLARQWLKRRATIRQLEALDDRMLADIGLRRRDIPAALDRLAAGGRSAAAAQTLEQANYWDSVVRVLRHWEMSREAAREIVRSGPDATIDLGGAEGEFDWVPAGVAGRRPQRHLGPAEWDSQAVVDIISPHLASQD